MSPSGQPAIQPLHTDGIEYLAPPGLERKLLVQDDIERGITKKIAEDNVSFLRALKACLALSAYVKKRQNAFWLTQAGQKAVVLANTRL